MAKIIAGDKLLTLSEYWNISEEAALQRAVDMILNQILEKDGTRLIPREDNQYDVTQGGKTVATIEADAIKGLSQKSLANMLAEGELGGTALIFLMAAHNNQGITFYDLKTDPED